jgi:hypothetical protein
LPLGRRPQAAAGPPPGAVSPGPSAPRREHPAGGGFTRIELLAVLGALALLAGLWLPALAGTGSGSAGAGCLNNLRQLVRAFLMFAEDHNGLFPKNPDDGSRYNWVAGNAGLGGQDQFNPDLLGDPAWSALANYLGRKAEAFRCPADQRVGRYQGTNAAWRGQIVPAARSYVMNGAVGTKGEGTARFGNEPVDGAWLDGFHSNIHNRPWRTYGRLSHMVEPTPSGLFVFLDEEPRSLNDGTFSFSMLPAEKTKWIDWPATYHDFGVGLGFADGHAELHAWQDVRTRIPNPPRFNYTLPNSPDVTWLQARTSALAR